MKYRYRRYVLYYLARTFAFMVLLLPRAVALPIGAFAGRVAFFVLPRYRRTALENLRFAFAGEKTPREIGRIAEKVFENLGKNAVEFLQMPRLDAGTIDRRVTIVGRERIDRALEAGRGVIILTAHFGNWELIAATLRIKKYPGAIVARRIYFHKYESFLNQLRKVHDVNAIYRDDSPKKILRVLRQNGIIGILADQDVESVDGVYVDFFGKKAYTPSGPAALARSSGAKLVPTFMVRQDGRHTLMIEDPIELVETGDREADLAANTQRWSRTVEAYIRRYPEQWVWMHRRWKTRPEGRERGAGSLELGVVGKRCG